MSIILGGELPQTSQQMSLIESLLQGSGKFSPGDWNRSEPPTSPADWECNLIITFASF